MAGQPLKQQLIRELEQRTRQTFEDEPEATHLDYVEDWQARGNTLNALAELCGLGTDNGEFISRYLKRVFGGEIAVERLTQARARGAHRLVEKAMDTAGKADEDSVNVARLQVSNLQWTAEKWNARELGAQKGTNVSISIGVLHLDSLRQQKALGDGAIDSAIAGECELVSSEIIES